jgi:hypothetical protein
MNIYMKSIIGTVVDQNKIGQSKFRLCNSIFLRNPSLKVQIHDEIFSCNFGLMIQKFHEQLNFIVETLVRVMKH